MRLIFFLVCLGVLLYGLFRPEAPPDFFYESDKFLHIIAFAGMSFATRVAFPKSSPWIVWGILLIAAPFSEWLQHQIQPSRAFSIYDAIGNFIGVVIGAICYHFYQRWIEPTLRNVLPNIFDH